MKNFISLLICICVSLSCIGQGKKPTPLGTPQSTVEALGNFIMDSSCGLPIIDITKPIPAGSARPYALIGVNKSDSLIYYYNGRSWVAVGSGGGGGGSSTTLTSQTSLSSAQILAIYTTPIQLIAAPGAGKIIVPWTIIVDYTFGTSPYSGGLYMYETTGSQMITSSNTINGSVNIIRIFMLYNGQATNNNVSVVDNAPLMVAGSGGGNPTGGDGTAKITVIYQIINR